MSDFIEYDNHNGIILLKTSLMNALDKVSKILDLEIKLIYIPYSLILKCLKEYNWDINEEWDDFSYNIDVYSGGIKIMYICGNVTEQFTTIGNIESTGILT